jgi:gamma-glutamylcyclotransferase (GGCT)/AIG2-like uncharacterized protein YtfP
MYKVGVYGTLKMGKPLSSHLLGSKFLGEHWLPGYAMCSLGRFPAIYPSKDSSILLEIYEVTPEVLARLDMVEGFQEDGSPYNLYDRETVDIVGNLVYVYTMPAKPAFSTDIPEGEW